MSEFCSTFAADLTYIQCMTVSAKAELKGNPVQIRDSPAAVNSCHRFNNMSLPQGGKTSGRGQARRPAAYNARTRILEEGDESYHWLPPAWPFGVSSRSTLFSKEKRYFYFITHFVVCQITMYYEGRFRVGYRSILRKQKQL